MSEPSVDEIVEHQEWRYSHNPNAEIHPEDVRALISDWRKRGEALADIAKQNTSAELYEECGEDWGDFQFAYDCLVAVARAAITQPQPPAATNL